MVSGSSVDSKLDLSDPNSPLSRLYAAGYEKQWDKLVALESRIGFHRYRSDNTKLSAQRWEALVFSLRVNQHRLRRRRTDRLKKQLWAKPKVVKACMELFRVELLCGCLEHQIGNWNSKFIYNVYFGVGNKKEDAYVLRVELKTLEIFDMLGNWDSETRPARLAKKAEVLAAIYQDYIQLNLTSKAS